MAVFFHFDGRAPELTIHFMTSAQAWALSSDSTAFVPAAIDQEYGLVATLSTS